jgi:hypothetical protein
VPTDGTARPRRWTRTLAARVSALAIGVGAAAGGLALAAGAGSCSGDGVVDQVCSRLVWTLSERVGVAAALVTAVVVLTMVGLARTASAGGDPRRSRG